MPDNFQGPALDRPATYCIKVEGRLDSSWSHWFDGMALTITENGQGQPVTALTGTVRDQAALHGLLARIRDLCLPLLLVRRLDGLPGSADEPCSHV